MRSPNSAAGAGQGCPPSVDARPVARQLICDTSSAECGQIRASASCLRRERSSAACRWPAVRVRGQLDGEFVRAGRDRRVCQGRLAAASYCSTTLAGMRPRSLTAMPWSFAHAQMSALRSRAPIKIIFELDGYLLCHPRLLAALGPPAPYKINCNGRRHPRRRHPGQRMRRPGAISSAPRQPCAVPGVPIAYENRLVVPDTLGTTIKLISSASWRGPLTWRQRTTASGAVLSPIYRTGRPDGVEIRWPRASALADRLPLATVSRGPGGRLRNVSVAGIFQRLQARRFGAPRCSSFLPAADAPISQICARSDSVEELSYLHRPSLRAGYPRLCWSRAACGSALAVPGLPVPGGVTPTGHACGGGCAAPLCTTPAHEGRHPGVRAVR